MRQLQPAAENIRPERVSLIECQRPVAGADSCEGRNRLPRRSALTATVLDLSGGSFAFVMATGIVSLAFMRIGHDAIGAALFALNLVRRFQNCARIGQTGRSSL
jgi:hypothetical protein